LLTSPLRSDCLSYQDVMSNTHCSTSLGNSEMEPVLSLPVPRMTSMEEEDEEDLPSDLEDMVSLAFLSSNSSLKGFVRE